MQRTSNKSCRGGAALHRFGRCDRVFRESCRGVFSSVGNLQARGLIARLRSVRASCVWSCKTTCVPIIGLARQCDSSFICRFAGRSNRSCGDGVACAESGVRSQRRHAHFIHANRHGRQQARARPCILLCHVCFERTLRTAGRLHFGSTTRHQLPSSRRHLPSFQQQVRLL